uniref:ERCC4 domain-containing protein n=1 Tax=viral metagenome TaxID=1070528 RepID=A0A6C0KVJ0_9ZZZZ
MIIKIDNREQELINLCKHYVEIIPNYKDITIIVEALPLGDIIICDNEEEKVIIERKSLTDLASSIKDGRYEEQSYRLNGLPHHNHNIIYLIEGDIHKMNSYQSNLFKNKIEKSTLYSTIVSLNYFKGFSVLRTFNLDETSIMICNMAYKIKKSEKENKIGFYSNKKVISNNNNIEEENKEAKESEKDYCSVVKKVKKENITVENIGEIMLCQIPGISSTTAIAIMKRFESISNLIIQLNQQPDIMKDLTYTNEKGQKRKISKTVIENITKFLYNK